MLPSDVHDRFYSVAYEAFQACLDTDASAPDATNNLARTKEALTALICSALRAVSKQRDIVSRLPVEVRTSCFRLLPLACRVSASHVCHAWRTAALSDRHMWSTYTTKKLVKRSKFKSLLGRSHPVPFKFHLAHIRDPPGETLRIIKLYQDVFSMLHDNAARLRSLALHDVGRGFIDDLLSKQLPLLEQLILPCDDVHMPDLRKRTLNGRLRHLHVRGLRFPGPCGSLPSVTTLTCTVVDIADMRRLLEIFPCVEKVRLLHVTERSRLPQRLPPSLRSLELHTTPGNRVNYSAIVRPWIGQHHLRKLGLQNCSTALTALRLFAEECNEFRSMQVADRRSGSMDLTLRSEDQLRVDLSIPNLRTLVQDLRNADFTMIRNLTSLAIPASALRKVINLLLLQLSSITHFEFILLDNSECMALDSELAAPALMRIPQLRTLAFICGTYSYIWTWASPARQRRLPLLITFNAARLERITVSTPHQDQLLDHDWTSFQMQADVVSVVDGTSRADELNKPLFQKALSDVYQIEPEPVPSQRLQKV